MVKRRAPVDLSSARTSGDTRAHGRARHAIDPLEELGDLILNRDFPRIAQVQPGKARDSLVLRTAAGKSSPAMSRSSSDEES